MLIPSGNVRVAIALHLFITALMRGIKPADSLSDYRESPTGSFVHISGFNVRASDSMICSEILTLDFI
jgi:hypothetical protein